MLGPGRYPLPCPNVKDTDVDITAATTIEARVKLFIEVPQVKLHHDYTGSYFLNHFRLQKKLVGSRIIFVSPRENCSRYGW